MAYYNNPNDPNFLFTSTTGGFEEYPLPTQQPVVDQFNGQARFQNHLVPVNQSSTQVRRLPDNRRGMIPRYHPYQRLTSGVPDTSTIADQAANFGKHCSGTLVSLSLMRESLGSVAGPTTYSGGFRDHDLSSWSNYGWPGVAQQPQYEHPGSSYPPVSSAGGMVASGSSTAIATPSSGKHGFLFATLGIAYLLTINSPAPLLGGEPERSLYQHVQSGEYGI